jgi:hypothetical protein
MAASPKTTQLPANGGNFANKTKNIENHRHIVIHRQVGQALSPANPTDPFQYHPDHFGGPAEPRPSRSGRVWEPAGELR